MTVTLSPMVFQRHAVVGRQLGVPWVSSQSGVKSQIARYHAGHTCGRAASLQKIELYQALLCTPSQSCILGQLQFSSSSSRLFDIMSLVLLRHAAGTRIKRPHHNPTDEPHVSSFLHLDICVPDISIQRYCMSLQTLPGMAMY